MNSKNKIMLDLDGVIANFYQGFSLYMNENYGCDFDPLTDPSSYSLDTWGHGLEKIDVDEASVNWMKQHGFANLPCYDGTKEFMAELMRDYDIYILTARQGEWDKKLDKQTKNIIKQDTYEWLKKLNIPTDRLHFIHDKIPFCKEHGISVIIEDKLETALKAAREGIHTILMNRGYNQSKSERLRIYRVSQFNEVLAQLKKLVQ